MEIIKKNIHMDYTKACANTQFVIAEDINLPDTKPDVDCICLEKGAVQIDEVKAVENGVIVRGRIAFYVLYHTEENHKALEVMEGKLPFEERVHIQGTDNGDSLKAEGDIEDLSIGIINSRKLSIQSVINICVKAEGIYDEEVPIGLHGAEGMEYRHSPIDVAQIAICKNDVFRIREEVMLPGSYPNLFRILWNTMYLDDLEIRPLEDKLSIQGDLRILLIYESDEETIRSIESVVPFSGNIDCYGCREGMIPDITCHIAAQDVNIRPDNDGEERMIATEVQLELAIKLYEDVKVELVTDVYGVSQEVVSEEKQVMLRSLLTKNTGKLKVAEHVRIGNKNSSILSLLHSEGKVCQEGIQIGDTVAVLTGMIPIQVLYISGDDSKPYDVLKAQIPYRYEMEIPGLLPGDRVEVQATLEHLQITILDGEEVDVKAVPVFSTTVFRQNEHSLVSDIKTVPLDAKKLGSLPGVVVYVVKPSDTLWGIGKKYYVSVERLKKYNNLSSDLLIPGQKLLIVKEGL